MTSVAASPNAVFAIESLSDTNTFGIGDGWGKGASFGDGSSNRDNGVRIDIALKVNITLSETDKLDLINQFLPLQPIYDDDTKAYFYEHGDGF